VVVANQVNRPLLSLVYKRCIKLSGGNPLHFKEHVSLERGNERSLSRPCPSTCFDHKYKFIQVCHKQTFLTLIINQYLEVCIGCQNKNDINIFIMKNTSPISNFSNIFILVGKI
jgi:hypothetical protein